MTNTDEQIARILARYGMPAEGNVWRAEDQGLIYHSALERLVAQAQINFDPPAVLRA